MPFGKFSGFQDCINHNKDKRSPGGYCYVIEQRILAGKKNRKRSRK